MNTYTMKERNTALLLIAKGTADFSNNDFYERLEEFNWIRLKRTQGIITGAELTYAGKDLCTRLLKNKGSHSSY